MSKINNASPVIQRGCLKYAWAAHPTTQIDGFRATRFGDKEEVRRGPARVHLLCVGDPQMCQFLENQAEGSAERARRT